MQNFFFSNKTGAIETIYANKFGSLRRFSEQELVDCDTNNWACDGGYPINSFYYAYKNGLVEEAFYPYKNIVLLIFIISSWNY